MTLLPWVQLRELQITNQQLQQLLQQKDVELLALQYVACRTNCA